MTIVVDASVVVRWLFEDEKSDAAEKVLRDIHKQGGSAPSLLTLEVCNALVVGVRRKRLSDADMHQGIEIVKSVPIQLDDINGIRVLSDVTKLAQLYELTVYDATYLELAMRMSIPIATFDSALRTAAKKAGVKNWIKS